MTNIIRNSAIAAAMLTGVALASTPALADHNHRHGHHGKSWSHNDWGRNDHFRNGYAYREYGYRNPYAYGYGNYYSRPGFSIYIR